MLCGNGWERRLLHSAREPVIAGHRSRGIKHDHGVFGAGRVLLRACDSAPAKSRHGSRSQGNRRDTPGKGGERCIGEILPFSSRSA